MEDSNPNTRLLSSTATDNEDFGVSVRNCSSDEDVPLVTPPERKSGGQVPRLSSPGNLMIIGAFSFAYTFGLANSAAAVWYFNSYGLSLIYLLIARLIGSFLTTYTQVIVGYFGDKMLFSGRYGRRKPFVVFGFLLQVMCLFFLASPPASDTSFSYTAQLKLFYWLIGWGTLFNVGSYIMYNPLSSWLIESSADEEDYVTITSLPVNVGSIAGGVCGLYATLYLQHFTFASIWAGIGIPSLIILVCFLPNPLSREACQNRIPDLIPSIRICMNNEVFRIVFFNKVILYSAIGIGVSMISFLIIFSLPYIKHNSQIVPFGIYLFIATICVGMSTNILVKFVLKRFDKLKIYKWLALAASVFSLLLLPMSFVNSETGLYTFLIISVLLGGLIASPLYLINQFFTRDIIIYDTYKTNLRRENMFQLALNLPSGLLESLLSSIPLTLLYATGFSTNPNYTDDDLIDSKYIWNDGSIWQMRLYASVLVSMLCLLSNSIMNKYPLTESFTNSINESLKSREMIEEAQADEIESNDKKDRAILDVGTVTQDVRNPMLMRNFSNKELDSLINSENMESAIFSLKRSIVLCIIAGVTCIVVLFLGIEMQANVSQTSYAILNVSLALLLSLQVCYECLRIIAAFTLPSGVSGREEIRRMILSLRAEEVKKEKSSISELSDGRSSEVPETILGSQEFSADDSLHGSIAYTTFLVASLIYASISCTLLVYPPI